MISSIPIWKLVVQLQPIYLPLGYINFFQEITTVMDIHFGAILGGGSGGKEWIHKDKLFVRTSIQLKNSKLSWTNLEHAVKNPLNQNTKREIVLRF